MTADDLKEFLADNETASKEAVKAKMIESLLTNHRWEISGEISAVVGEFVKTEIVPEVKKFLQDQKGPILEAAVAGAATIGDTLAKSIVERCAKNLAADSYQFRAVMEAIFKH